MSEVTLWWDGRKPVKVDSDELELIQLMIVEDGCLEKLALMNVTIGKLVEQGYDKGRAQELVILARRELLGKTKPGPKA